MIWMAEAIRIERFSSGLRGAGVKLADLFTSRKGACMWFVLISLSCIIIYMYVLSVKPMLFDEVHISSGIIDDDFDSSDESISVSWIDFNNDGYYDLWTNNHGYIYSIKKNNIPTLYLNLGDGSFRKHRSKLFADQVRFDGHQSTWGDFDNDGDPDIYWNCGGRKGAGIPTYRILLKNNGYRLDNVSKEYGIRKLIGSGRGALWIDYNNDGLLDLISANIFVNEETGMNPSQLLESTPNGFVDVSKKTGFAIPLGAHFATYTTLFNANKKYIVLMNGDLAGTSGANDPFFSGVLWYNAANGTFENLREKLPAINFGKDAIISDFNGDLVNEILIVRNERKKKNRKKDITNNMRDENEHCDLLPQYLSYDSIKDRYVDRTHESGLTDGLCAMNIVAGDFDNDMDIDFWVSQFKYAGFHHNIALSSTYFDNNGNGCFSRIPHANGAEYQILYNDSLVIQDKGLACAVADYDNDGFLDIYTAFVKRYIVNSSNQAIPLSIPSQLFHNKGNKNHWIEIDLVGVASNRDAIGATIYVTAGGKTQLREVTGGNHKAGQDMKRVHVGLGKNQVVEEIKIVWPSGCISSMRNSSANQIVTIKEPK